MRWGSRCVVTVTLLVVALASTVPSAADGNEAPGAPSAYRTIAAGGTHVCAVLASGQVKCWGRNHHGQLGLGDTVARGDGPSEMADFLPVVPLGVGRTAVALAASTAHTCALLDDASVKCWGSNQYGQLGLGDSADRGDAPGEMGDSLPAVALGAGRTATALTAGDSHTCVLLDDGAVKCWGRGLSGRLGQGDVANRGDGPAEMGDDLPAIALGAGRVATAVSAGFDATCALLDDGSVKCWGDNAYGQLGLGDTIGRGGAAGQMGEALPAVALGGGRTARSITLGLFFACALLDDGSVKCWGYNLYGQLGLGDKASRGDGPAEMGDSLPAVSLGAGRSARGVAAGDFHVCAVLDDGSVKCWGNNSAGQLGVGDTNGRGATTGQMGDSLPAVSLGTGRTALAVTGGSYYACARLDDLGLRCWGHNLYGQLGQGDTASRGDSAGELGDALGVVALGRPDGPLPGIGGRVVESGSSAPVAGAFVAVLRSADFSLAGGAVAGGDGSYQVLEPPGAYVVFVLDPLGDHTAGFVGPPTPVTVGTLALARVDATMAPLRGRVTGIVVEDDVPNPREAPRIPGTWVIEMSGSGTPGVGATANSIGWFSFDRLSPGPHHFAFVDPSGNHRPQYWYRSTDMAGAIPANVAVGATTQIEGWLPRSTSGAGSAGINGTITEQGSGEPLIGVRVVALRAATFELAAGTTTAGDGSYHLGLVPGDYRLVFLDPAAGHRTEWYDDQPPAGLATSTAVTAPGSADAALEALTGRIVGQVSDQVTSGGLPGAWVIVISAAGSITGSAVTDAAGGYTVSGLAPGSYRVAVVDPTGTHPQEYWPDSPTFAGATPLAVTAGGVAVADATLG